MSDLKNPENLNYDEKIKFLEDENLIDMKLNELTNNNLNNKEKIKPLMLKLMEKYSNSKKTIIKILSIISFQKSSYNLTFENLFNFFGKYIYIEDLNDIFIFLEQHNSENIISLIRQKWIIKLFQNKTVDWEDINKIIQFIKNLSDEVIESLIEYTSIKIDIKKLIIFLENNRNLKSEMISIVNLIIKNHKNIINLINNITICYISKKIKFPKEDTNEYKIYVLFIISLIKIDWKIDNILKFFNSNINKLRYLDINFLFNIIIPIIVDNKISYESRNYKKENLISIFKNYGKIDLEYLIKDLAIKQKLKGINEKDLDFMIEQLREKNNGKMDESLILKIKYLIEKTRYFYNSISESDISIKKINQYNSQDILYWSKPEYTKKSINNENFLSEAITVVDRALK